jgi:hypothetical protein
MIAGNHRRALNDLVGHVRLIGTYNCPMEALRCRQRLQLAEGQDGGTS